MIQGFMYVYSLSDQNVLEISRSSSSTYEEGDVQQSFLLGSHVQVTFGRGQDVRVHPILTTDADEHHAADHQESVLITAILCEQV